MAAITSIPDTTSLKKKRKTRPYLSPPTLHNPHRQHRYKLTSKATTHIAPFSGSSTSSLDFEDFSFITSDGVFSQAHVSREQRKTLVAYLVDNYDIDAVQFSGPFIVLECGKGMPRPEERPFTIAGLIAIWQSSANRIEFIPLIGEAGEGGRTKINPSMLVRMEAYKLPPDDVIIHLAEKVFPDCIAISVMDSFMIVELPDRSNVEFSQHLRTLPAGIDGAPYALRFHNGQLPNTPRRSRAVMPCPQRLDNFIADETDYVKQDGQFYPGSMLCSLAADGEAHGFVTAGVLVEKGSERRLTCSWHNWEDIDNEHPGLFGEANDDARNVFRVAQGLTGDTKPTEPGTTVGFVHERIGKTDIALAQLNNGIKFSNDFMDINTSAKSLLSSQDLAYGDIYEIDSFVTGVQKLHGHGMRAQIARSRRSVAHPQLYAPEGHQHLLPPGDIAYIACKQGAYATNAPMIVTTPQIRDTACGSVLVRCSSMKEPHLSESDVLKRGEICGMFHFADLQPKYAEYFAANFLIYADVFDPLIGDGWSIVVQDEKMGGTPETNTELEESPAKRQRKD